MGKLGKKRTKYPFNLRDWVKPLLAGMLGGGLFALTLQFLCDRQLQDLSKDMSNITITFAFTFLGFLISAYAILQTVVEGLPDSESLKTSSLPREEKFKKRAKMRLVGSDLFKTFKGNLLRVACLSLFLLIASIVMKPIVYLDNRSALYIVNAIEMFGILLISIAGYGNLSTLFLLI